MTPRRHPRLIKVPIICGLILIGSLSGNGCDDRTPPTPEKTAGPRDAARAEEALQAIEVWLGKGDAEKAGTIAEKLVEVDPSSPDAREAHAVTLVALGAEAASKGEASAAETLRKRALTRYEEAIELSEPLPRSDMLHAAGIIAESVSREEQALGLYQRAAEADSDNPSHPLYAGNVLIKMDRPDEAGPWFTKALEIDPAEPWGWAGRAAALRQQARFDEALSSIRNARKAANGRNLASDLPFRVSEARILRESGRPNDSARLLFAIDPEIRSSSRAVTIELHLACELVGDHVRSAEVWAAFHASHPENAEALFMVAESWLRAGREDEAASWYQLARDIGMPEDGIQEMMRKARERAERDRSGQ